MARTRRNEITYQINANRRVDTDFASQAPGMTEREQREDTKICAIRSSISHSSRNIRVTQCHKSKLALRSSRRYWCPHPTEKRRILYIFQNSHCAWCEHLKPRSHIFQHCFSWSQFPYYRYHITFPNSTSCLDMSNLGCLLINKWGTTAKMIINWVFTFTFFEFCKKIWISIGFWTYTDINIES